MSLESREPKFDRPFEDLFRELRERIPRYNPLWTNFNESDPGITLLQLFAWLAEMTLHKMSDVPRKNYLKFARLLGLELAAPRPATVRLVFTPKPAERPRPIPERTRCSAQVEGDKPATVVFETKEALDVIGAPLDAMLVSADGTVRSVGVGSAAPTEPFWPLGRNPAPGDALYLAFKPNPGNPTPFPSRMRFLALRPEAARGAAQRAGEQDRDLLAPVDLVWEYRPKDGRGWEPLALFADGTVALTRDGYVEVEGPSAIDASLEPLAPSIQEKRYWIRLRLERNRYPAGRAPRLELFLPNAVDAVQLVTTRDTQLGASDGSADQRFDFPHPAVDPGSLQLEIRRATGEVEKDWRRVDDFHASTRDDKHFVLNATAGRVSFGDGEHGQIPPAGAQVVAVTWRHGGGRLGNDVAAGAVKTLVDQIRGIEKVTNPRAAAGGADEQSLEDFIKKAPGELRRGGRAVTERDFEAHACAIAGVRKARAVGGRHPDFPDVTVPGAVTVFVVADSDARPPAPSAELVRSLCRSFDGIRLVTTELFVAPPRFVEIRIEALLRAAPEASFDQVAADARRRLEEFLSPAARDFGENVSPAAVYACLFGSAGARSQVRSVENLFVYVDGLQHDLGRPIDVRPDAIVFSGEHLIVVRPDQDDRTSR